MPGVQLGGTAVTDTAVDSVSLPTSTQLPSDAVNSNDAITQPTLSTSQQLAIVDQVFSQIEQRRSQASFAQAMHTLQPHANDAQVVSQAAAADPQSPVAPVSPTPSQTPPINVQPLAQVAPQAMPQVLADDPGLLAGYEPQQAPVSGGSGGAKERFQGTGSVVSSELPGGMQAVEFEATPEIQPELAEYLQQVEDTQNQMPNEVAIAQDQQQMVMQVAPIAQPVIVLPLTPEVEKAGEKRSSQFSIRWLVEWSRKIMKIFEGKVVYRDPLPSELDKQ